MPAKKKPGEVSVLPEYVADNLGVPFKVVLVKSVKQITNKETGEVDQIVIPNLRGLLQQIALSRILIPRKLSGKDIKFIRKALPIKAGQLAEKIGVTPEHLSRCEAGERALSLGTEKCLRIAVLLEQCRLPDQVKHLCEKDGSVRKRVEVFEKALCKIESIINGMTIPAAYNSEDELCLSFRTVPKPEKSLFDEDIEADWSAQAQAA